MPIRSESDWKTKKTTMGDMRQKTYTGRFTRAEIRKIAQANSNAFKKFKYDGVIQVTLRFPSGKYYSAQSTKVGDPVNVFKMIEHYDDDHKKYEDTPDVYKTFILYTYGTPKK